MLKTRDIFNSSNKIENSTAPTYFVNQAGNGASLMVQFNESANQVHIIDYNSISIEFLCSESFDVSNIKGSITFEASALENLSDSVNTLFTIFDFQKKFDNYDVIPMLSALHDAGYAVDFVVSKFGSLKKDDQILLLKTTKNIDIVINFKVLIGAYNDKNDEDYSD